MISHNIESTCLILFRSCLWHQNSPDPSSLELRKTLESFKTLEADPLCFCKPQGGASIGLLYAAHRTDSWSDWDLGNLLQYGRGLCSADSCREVLRFKVKSRTYRFPPEHCEKHRIAFIGLPSSHIAPWCHLLPKSPAVHTYKRKHDILIYQTR